MVPLAAMQLPGSMVESVTNGHDRALSTRRLLVDALLALLLVVLDLLVSWDVVRQDAPTSRWVAPVYLAIGYLALIWRRRFPVWVLAVLVLHSALAFLLVPGLVPTLGVWLALYTVAALCDRRTAVLGLVGALVPTALNVVDEVNSAPGSSQGEALITSVTLGVMFDLAMFGVGRWVRWSRRMRSLIADLAADHAVFAERQRVARELHDVVAHSVSLMVLQSGSALASIDRDNAAARQAMVRVADLGQQTVVELRRLLGLLDAPMGDNAEDRLTGIIANIPTLVENARAAGATIDLVVEGTARAVDPSVDRSGYRIAQEALTNAVKYGDLTQPIRVRVRWSSEGVEIAAVNRCQSMPHGGPSEPSNGGRGLIGMRERARAVGGTFASDRRHLEFEVKACLPTRERPDVDPRDQRPERDHELA